MPRNVLAAAASVAAVAAVMTPTTSALHSVLLITVDDLRPQLNVSYGMDMTSTPNVDRLTREGTTFLRAYCQMAVCSPSRNSFMTGRRPDTTQVWNFVDSFRDAKVGINWTTMPQYFKQQASPFVARARVHATRCGTVLACVCVWGGGTFRCE